jgi:hypothetical protein
MAILEKGDIDRLYVNAEGRITGREKQIAAPVNERTGSGRVSAPAAMPPDAGDDG